MAEYYRLPEWETLPVGKLAALVYGLPAWARSKQKFSGQAYSDDMLMTAILIDRVSTIAWMMTEDGARGRNRPESLYLKLTGQEKGKEITAYRSGDEFEAARNEILRRGGFIK